MKRIRIGLLSLGVALVLVACGGGGAPPSGGTPTTGTWDGGQWDSATWGP